MDQPFYWNNTLLSPSGTQTLPDYLSSPSDMNMDFQNVVHQDNEGSSRWTSLNPNAAEFRGSQANDDGSKLEGWNTALLINSGGGPRLEDRHPERTRILSLGNMDINLNSTRADEGQSLAQALSFSQLSQQTTENNAKLVDTHTEIAQMPMHFHIPVPFELENVPFSNSDGSSSSGVGLTSADSDGGLGNAMEGYRLACKRKNIEGAIGKSSSSVNTLFFQQNDSNYVNPSLQTHGTAENASNTSSMHGANSFEEQLISSLSTIEGGFSSECDPSSSITEKAETSLRNFRVRLNPESQHDMASPKPYAAVCNSRPSSIWSPGEPSSLPGSLNHSPVESLPVPPFPCLPGHVFPSKNGASSSRSATSSRSGNSELRSINLCDESNIGSMPRSDMSDHSALCIGTNSGHLAQCPPSGNLSNTNMIMTGKLPSTSRASSSSRVDSFQGLIHLLPELVSVQYPRNPSEIVFGSSLPSGGPVSGCQSSNFSALQSGQSASSQESGQSSGAYPQGSSQHTRSTISLDRQRDGMRSVPFSIRNREGRDRMISEIRNVLELMRRGENVHFEDSLIRDHYSFLEHVDLQDRHRDMRLDVDNMSYEELLALEDRIGYVSTGLGEDTILTNLRQLKYSSCKLELASAEHEPCCICREEYTEGEDIGMLGCSHDFHTACIKQWLMIKNLCPICKTTAFVT